MSAVDTDVSAVAAELEAFGSGLVEGGDALRAEMRELFTKPSMANSPARRAAALELMAIVGATADQAARWAVDHVSAGGLPSSAASPTPDIIHAAGGGMSHFATMHSIGGLPR